MLFHLPIAILTTLSPIPVSDAVPKFDIVKECRFEGGSSQIFERCSHDETEALEQLQSEWPQFAGTIKSACLAEATVAGFASYVDLIICLEMGRDADNNTNSPAALEGQSTPPAQPETNVVDRHE
jgi:hypothetical protein